MFVSTDDLKTLTGYRLPCKQREWLERNGVPHTVNAAGRPVVLAATVERIHGVRKQQGDDLIHWDKVA